MPQDDHTEPSISELELHLLSLDDFGWTSARAQLSNEAYSTIKLLASKRCEEDKLPIFMERITRAFANAVETAEIDIQRIAINTAQQSGSKSKRKPSQKIGVSTRDNIRRILKDVERSKAHGQCIELDGLIRQIEEDKFVDFLLSNEIEAKTRPFVPDPLRNNPDLTVEAIEKVLRKIDARIDNAITTGPSFSAHRYIAFAVINTITEVTGKVPGRLWNAHSDSGQEQGWALGICRVLARELWHKLPENFRENEPADMARPFRKALLIYKAEQS